MMITSRIKDRKGNETGRLIKSNMAVQKREREVLYVLVKDDLNRISWWGLNDPLTIEGFFIKLRPAWGQNDAARSLQVSTTWS